ncbi:MAG: sulfite exporter TauE/SafE family protein, partial [Alphaproteobacteria bacterium]|nr:sulfite exporter TauE/SafE family protein [Alphaproteobacteria bacterium]
AKLLFGRDSWALGEALPGRAAMIGYGFMVGLASSLMGISGGSLVTMVLTLYGVPIHTAVATAAGIGVPITIAGTIGYLIAGLPHRASLPPPSVGFISVIGVVMIAPISSWVAPFGARLAHALPRSRLEIGFGLFLIAAALRFVASLLGA